MGAQFIAEDGIRGLYQLHAHAEDGETVDVEAEVVKNTAAEAFSRESVADFESSSGVGAKRGGSRTWGAGWRKGNAPR